MRNRVLFLCVLVFWLCGAGCQTDSKKPVVASKPVEVPPSRIFTLFWQQLVSLDWHSSGRTGARVMDKRVFSFSPAVEFDIYFPSNNPGSQSLDFVSSGEGGKGTLVGTDIRGYETFALKFNLVSINKQSGPEMKQKLVAGAVIGLTNKRQLRNYEPVTMGLAASEKTVIAKTPVSTDKIYQIGFHLHMLNPQDWDQSGSMVRLRIEPVVEPAEKPIEEPFEEPVKEGEESIVPATIPIKKAPNLPPVAEPHSVTTTEDTLVEIRLMGSDPDLDPLAYSTITEPSHGSLIGTEPNLIYTPNPNFYGSDSFTFKVNDGTADSALATVSITVSSINDPPMADDDTAETQEDMPIVRIDVLANDTDVDDDSLKIITVTQGKNGSVTINPDSTLAYSPHAKFYGSDVFTYTISDDKGLTDTAKVNVKVKMVNDAPVITSAPVTTAIVGALYTYDVNAADPDLGDKLTYSLTTKPPDMTINSTTGLIQWKPAKVGDNKVVVKVADSYSTPAFDTQSFTITVNPASPKIEKLTVLDGYNQRTRKTLSADGKTKLVQSSDNNRGQIDPGSYTSYDFSDLSIPADAEIKSVVVRVEHFEEEGFAEGKLEWSVGTGWPTKPVVWASINAPVHEGQPNEAVDSWDVTSVVDTREKINSLQLQVKNNEYVAKRKTSIDYIYLLIECD